MRVSRIHIKNVMGIEELEILEPGSLTTVEAKNGKGKTSLFEALRSISQGGHDATLLRNGAERGEVVIVLDDETTITKRITRDKSDLTVTRPDVGKVSSPKQYVDRLFNALSVNPIEFLMLPEKQQTDALLEALPLELDREAVEDVIGDAIPLRDSDFRGHPLDVLSALHRRIYDERTGVNRAAKEKSATVEQLSGSLSEDDTDPAERAATIALLETERAEIAEKLEEQRGAIADRFDSEATTVCASIDKEIDELNRRLSALEVERATRMSEINSRRQGALLAAKQEADIRTHDITSELRSVRERETAATAAENTRQVVATMRGEADRLTEKSRELTAALGALDGIKLGLLKDLPIKGIEIRDGVLYKGDVPFRRLNRAEQVKVAIRLAQIRAGDVPLVCVDGIELLDGDTFKAFKANAAKTNMQFVVTRVTPETADAPEGLRVETAGVA